MTATAAITPFNFNAHAVRVIIKDGNPWFVAKDICDTLGYANSRKTLADHLDDDEKGVTNSDTLGGSQIQKYRGVVHYENCKEMQKLFDSFHGGILNSPMRGNKDIDDILEEAHKKVVEVVVNQPTQNGGK